MRPWTLIEPCCGTAALALHLLGARRQLTPRQGSKWSHRRALAELVARLGYVGAPARVVLSDADPWGVAVAWALVGRETLLERLRPLVAAGERDPRALHDRLHGAALPLDPARMAAELLWLQRMAYAGKAVRTAGGRWVSPGLNLTSAYGVPATDRFGEVRPLGPSLLRAIEALPPVSARVDAEVGLVVPTGPVRRTLVYLDPDYVGSTGYSASIPRSDVVELAVEWTRAGATVLVSEAEAVEELRARGWSAEQIGQVEGKADRRLVFRSRSRVEWVTYAGPTQLSLFGCAA